MTFSMVAVSAIAPSLLLMWFFHQRDVFPEPPRILWTTFFLGVFTIPFVLMIAGPLVDIAGVKTTPDPYMSALGKAFLGAAVPEELLKFLVVFLYSARRSAFDEPMDGIVYGAAASLGFATLENVLYVATGDLSTAILRACTAVPGHAFGGALMGYFIGQAKFRPAARGRLLFQSLFWPILLHGFYDFGLMLGEAFKTRGIEPSESDKSTIGLFLLVTLLALVIEVVWTLRAQRRLRREQTALRDGPSLAAPRASKGGVLGAWVRVLIGGLLVAFGGLLALGMILGLAVGEAQAKDVTIVMIGMLIVMGVGPLLGGTLLFARGVQRLNQSAL